MPLFAQSQFFDVPFVPTPQVVVDEMLRLAGVGPRDLVFDLGSGDGRIVITAARKFGARAIGVELDEHLIYQSEESARQANVLDRVKFLQQDFFKTDFSEATVITMYLLPGVMKRLRARMLDLKPGTRLVAHDFDFEDWRPDRKTTIRKNVFLWIVPAKVAGAGRCASVCRAASTRSTWSCASVIRSSTDTRASTDSRAADCGNRSSKATASASSSSTAAIATRKRRSISRACRRQCHGRRSRARRGQSAGAVQVAGQKAVNALRRRRAWPSLRICGALLPARTGSAFAQAADVPYVPTPSNVVEAMLDIAKVGPGDFLIDLGSGRRPHRDYGRKKNGARGFGVDLDPGLVNDARREAEREGVKDKVEFHARNLFITDIDRATVLTLYLLPRVNMELRPRIFSELRPGTRVVSHEFDFGNWKPDAQKTIDVPDKPYGPPSSTVYLWIVPANVAGRWQWKLAHDGAPVDYDLVLEQTFQEVRGSARVAQKTARVESASVRGDQIALVLVAEVNGREVRHELAGRVAGDTITGTARV